jgi:hypothetical protein
MTISVEVAVPKSALTLSTMRFSCWPMRFLRATVSILVAEIDGLVILRDCCIELEHSQRQRKGLVLDRTVRKKPKGKKSSLIDT